MDSILKLGQVDPDDKLGCDFHNAARNGNRRVVKKILDKGMPVDYPNNAGQSPLFCACYSNQDSIVKELLMSGANPNERSNIGMTPVHMVAYNCNLKLLTELLAAGGDLRLHDSNGRTSREFAMLQPELKKRMKMLEFIEKTRLFALTKSGRDLRASARVPDNIYHNSHKTNSVLKLIRDKIKGESRVNLDHQMKSCQSMGFGKVYQDGESFSGIICTLPLVSETLLTHDKQGFSFNNGSFMVMESMLWKNTNITVKRLHREAAPGGEVDLLITEAEYIGKLRHPNVLILMGVCQTNNLENMVLLFERVEEGSLYEVLHQKRERLSTRQIEDVTRQISDALIFLHEQNIIHCFVTSHAIMLVDSHCAKLANFEYVVDCAKVDIGKKSFVNQNMYQNVAYNWMAPEIMRANPASAASDVYSLTVVVWEMFHGEVPWGKYDTETVRYKILKEREQLEIESDRIPEVFQIILQYGLQLDPLHRKLQMFNIRNLLLIPKQNVKLYMDKLLKIEEENRPSKPPSKPPPKPARPKTWKRDGETLNNTTPRERDDRSLSKSPSPTDIPDVAETPRGHHDRSGSKSPKAESTPRRKPDHVHYRDGRYNHNQSSKDATYPDYTQNDRYRFVDRMQFSHKDLDWELKEEQQGADYYYTVKVNKDEEVNHGQSSDQSESEVESTTSIPTSENGGNRSLVSKFSYLKVQQQCKSPPGRCVKPASHCTDAHTECPQERKLSTAGSVFALYNMDYNTPQRVETDVRSQLYNTMPRKRKRMGIDTPKTTELGPSVKEWFGGAGSVKNLVELYQKQEDDHTFQQDVLQGKMSTADISKHQVTSIYPDIRNISPCKSPEDYNNQAGHGTSSDPKRQSLDATNCSSLTTVSPEDCKDKKTGSSPDESEWLDSFIDNELYRIQSTLSQEVFEAIDEQRKENISPLLFEDKCSSTPSTSKKKPLLKLKKKIKQKKKKDQYEVEEFFIDDEISPDTCKLNQRKPVNTRNNQQKPDYIKKLRDDINSGKVNRVTYDDSVNQEYRRPPTREEFLSTENRVTSKNKQWQNYRENQDYRRQYLQDKIQDSENVTHNSLEYRQKQYQNRIQDSENVSYKPPEYRQKYYDDSDVSSDSSKIEKKKQLKKLHTSFHSIPQHYDDLPGPVEVYSREAEDDVYPRIVETYSETDQQKLKNKVDEKAAFASTVIVETNTIYPDQHRVTHTLTDLSDGTTSTLYGKNVKATRIMSAMIAQ